MTAQTMTSKAVPTRTAASRPFGGVVVGAAGVFASVASIPMLLLASPAIASDFSVTVSDLQWRNLLFWTFFGVWLPVCGGMTRRVDARLQFDLGVLVFVVSAVLATSSHSWPLFLAASALQGLADALVVSAQPVLYQAIVSEDQLGWAFGLQGAVIAVAQLASPAVGGILLETVSWRIIMLGLAGVALLVLAASRQVLPPTPRAARTGDVPAAESQGRVQRPVMSAALLTVAVAAIQGVVLVTGTLRLVLVIVGVVGLLAFLGRERAAAGYLPEGLRQHRRFAAIALRGILIYFPVNAIAMFLPVLLTVTDHVSTGRAGFVLLPDACVVTVLGTAAGKFADRRPGASIRIGFVAMLACSIALAANSASIWLIVSALIALGAGLSLAVPAQSKLAMSAAPASDTGRYMAIFNSAQFVSIGLATVLFAPLIQGAAEVSVSRSGFAAVCAVSAVLFVIGALSVPIAGRRRADSAISGSQERSCVG